MLTVGLSPRRLLLLGAHSDDVEIGCGGTLMLLLRQYPQLEVHWVVFSAAGARLNEARASAEALLANAGPHRLTCFSFRDGFLPYAGAELKDCFERLKGEVDPDLILTHTRDDAHQDHRLVSELTWNTFRDHLILEFEIPKYDGDLGRPNVFIQLDEDGVKSKIDHLQRHFGSQHGKRWFTEELFRSLMRLRGMESNSPAGYAEAFYARKLVVSV
jgi:LmbE family N-acetylglucosaminyl deacetylase